MSGKKKSVVESALRWLDDGGFFEKEPIEPSIVMKPIRWSHVKVDMSGFSLGPDEMGSAADRKLADDILKRSRSERLDAAVNTALIGQLPPREIHSEAQSSSPALESKPMSENKSSTSRSVTTLPTVTVDPEQKQNKAIFKTLEELSTLASAVADDILAIESSRVNSPRLPPPETTAHFEAEANGDDIVYASAWPRTSSPPRMRFRGVVNWNFRPN